MDGRLHYGSLAGSVVQQTMSAYARDRSFYQERNAPYEAGTATGGASMLPAASLKRPAHDAGMARHSEIHTSAAKRARTEGGGAEQKGRGAGEDARKERAEVYKVSEKAASSLPATVLESLQLACRKFLPSGEIDAKSAKISVSKCVDEFSVRVTGIQQTVDCSAWRKTLREISGVRIVSSNVSLSPPDGPSIIATFHLANSTTAASADVNSSSSSSNSGGDGEQETRTDGGSTIGTEAGQSNSSPPLMAQFFRGKKYSLLKPVADRANDSQHEWAIPSAGRLVPTMDSRMICTAMNYLRYYRQGSTPYPLNISVTADKEAVWGGERLVPRADCKGARHMSEKEGRPSVYYITVGKLSDVSLADLDTLVALMPFHLQPLRVNIQERTLLVGLRAYTNPLRVRWTMPAVAPVYDE